MPCPGPFHFLHIADYIYDVCPLPVSGVGHFIIVCDDDTSFHFGLRGRKFVLCLFGQCPCICVICHRWQHTVVVHLSLQADDKVAFEDIPVFGVCRPACHVDSSLYLFGLVLFHEVVAVYQIYVAFNIFYQHIVNVYWSGVYYLLAVIYQAHLWMYCAKDQYLCEHNCFPSSLMFI